MPPPPTPSTNEASVMNMWLSGGHWVFGLISKKTGSKVQAPKVLARYFPPRRTGVNLKGADTVFLFSLPVCANTTLGSKAQGKSVTLPLRLFWRFLYKGTRDPEFPEEPATHTPVPAPAPTSCPALLPGSAFSLHRGFLKGQKCETRGCPDLPWKIRECQIMISKKYALKSWSICFVPTTLLGTAHMVVSQIDTA